MESFRMPLGFTVRDLLRRPRAIKLGVFIGLFTLALIWLRSPGDLETWKRRMIERGERLTFAEVAPPFSPSAVAWELSLSNAASRLAEQPHDPGAMELMATNRSGFAPAVWKRQNPTGAMASNFWGEFVAQMNSNATVLADVRALLAARPRGSVYDPARPTDRRHVYNYVARRRVAYDLAAASVCALRQGRTDQALACLAALIDLARTDDSIGELLRDQAIRAGVAGLALKLTWETCQAPGLDDHDLAGLYQTWQKVDLLTNLTRMVEMERAFGLAYFDWTRTDQTAMRNLAIAFGHRPVTEWVRDAALDRFWHSWWLEKDELLFLQTLQPILEGVRSVSTNDCYSAFRARARESRALLDGVTRGRVAQLRHSLTLIASQNWETALRVTWSHEALRRVTLGAIAVKRYQLRRGRSPESLQALVPEFLPGELLDPMTRRPLRYHPLPGQAFLLYSVGENGQDDGGLGDDIYWPRLGSSEQE